NCRIGLDLPRPHSHNACHRVPNQKLRQIYSQPRSRKKSSKIKTQNKEIYGILHDSLQV
ncbi:unnamed protein product, partial [Arabidopsis halleri]